MNNAYKDLVAELIDRCEALVSTGVLERGDDLLQLIARIRAERRQRVIVNAGGRLELHRYPDRNASPREELFYRSALKHKQKDGELKIDESATISEADSEHGEYVLAWIRVSNEDAVFPRRFEVDLYYPDEARVLHHFDRDHVLAYDQDQAEQQLLDRHWSSWRFSSGWPPYVDFHEVEMNDFQALVEDPRDPMAIRHEHQIEAHCKEDVLECLAMLYPVEEIDVTIRDRDGSSWRVEQGEFVADDGEPDDPAQDAPRSDGIDVTFHSPRTIRGRTYAVEQVFLRLGGTPIPGENFAAKCDDAHWLSTRQDVERWLVDRGLSTNEAQNLLLDAIERQERDREKP